MLFKAASAGLSTVVAALLREGADKDGGMAKRQNEQVKKNDLVGTTPNVRHRLTPLHAAVSNSHASVVDGLLLARADPQLTDRRGSTALHLAAPRSSAACVTSLLKTGTPPDVLA